MTAPTPHPDRAEQTEVVHACPPDGKAVTPCCGRSPFELLRSDRLTADPGLVTCTGRAEQSKPWPNPLDEAGRPICVCTLERACAMHADRAEQAQPSGYTPPEVGAPTWPLREALGHLRVMVWCCIVPDHRIVEWRGDVAHCQHPGCEVTSEHTRAFAELLREVAGPAADRDRLRAVIAAALVDLLAGRVDEAAAALRAAGGQP